MRCFSVKFVVLIWLGIFMSCSDGTEDATETGLMHVEKGWDFYAAGNYAQALLSFERALNFDESLTDAYNGIGWSHLSLSLTIPVAQEAFQNAIQLDGTHGDAWVGLANVLYLRQKDTADFNAAIRALDNALNSDTPYFFRHDYDSNAALYALKAACYYYLGENQIAKQEIDNALQIDSENRTALVLNRLLKKNVK